MCRLSLAVATLLLASCVEPNLGDSPFYCNGGSPECPEGYVCVKTGGQGRCVKPGFTAAAVQGMVADAGVDTGLPQQDGPVTKTDLPRTDGPVTKWDKGPLPPDQKIVPPVDTGPQPHLGCQTNQECTTSDPTSPCCCPMPFVPLVWTCLPLCLDPLCI